MTWNLTFSFQTKHSVSPFFPLQLPFRSATQATTEFLVSLYLCLFWVVKDARGEWILTTTTPHNSSHPLKPTHSLHYQAHHSNRSAKGTSSPCLQGLVFLYFRVFSATKWDSCAIPPMRHQDITQQTFAVFCYEVTICGWPIRDKVVVNQCQHVVEW